jgi:hypothetical protein
LIISGILRKSIHRPITKVILNNTVASSEKASGISVTVKYDTKKSDQPAKWDLCQFAFSAKFTLWEVMQIGNLFYLNWTYIPFPARSRNILAFWSYNWFTVGGSPPYLLCNRLG